MTGSPLDIRVASMGQGAEAMVRRAVARPSMAARASFTGQGRELEGHSNFALSEKGRYAATMGHGRNAHGSACWLRVWDLEHSSPNPVIHEQLPDGCWALSNRIRALLSISDDGRVVTAVASNTAPAPGPLRRWELGKGLAAMYDPPIKQDGRPGKMQVPSYNTERKSCSCYHDFRPCAVTADGSTGVDFYGNEGREWDLATGTMTPLLGHSDYIECACITPDGRYAATGAADHTVRVWDVKSGACIALITDKESVEDVVLSPDGRYVLTQGCSEFGAAQVWQLTDIDARGQPAPAAFGPAMTMLGPLGLDGPGAGGATRANGAKTATRAAAAASPIRRRAHGQ